MTLVLALLARLSPAWRLLLAFLRSPIGQVVAVALIFGSLAWWHGEVRYGEGAKAERARWEARQAAAATKARATEARNANASQAVGKAVAVETVKIQWRTKTLIQQVPTYVPIDPSRASLPVGLVRVHDAAALGVPVATDSAGRADDAASGIDDVALGETVVGNYGACHENAARLKGWQDWWAAVSAPSTPSMR